MDIKTIRKNFPQYDDLSDDQLIKGLHKAYYNDMPYDQFVSKISGQQKSSFLMDALNFIPSLGDAASRGVIGAGSRALTGVQAIGGGLSSLVGREEEASQRFKAMEDRQRATEQFLQETYPDTGSFKEKLVGGAAQIPSYINPFVAGATILGTGIEEQQRANQAGVDPETAKRAGYIGSIGNATMMAIPGAGAVKGALVGGGTAFVGEQAQIANLELNGYEKAAAERKKEVFDATVIGTLIGGGVGAATKSKPQKQDLSKSKATLDEIDAQKKQQAQEKVATAEQQAAEAAAIQEGARRTQQQEFPLDIPNDVDVSGVRNRYDVTGRISDLAAGMETAIDSPQRDLFAQGLREQVYNRPDIQAAELALLQAKDRARSTQEQGAINRELEAGYRLLEQDKPRDALDRPLYEQQPFLVQPGGVQEGRPINLNIKGNDSSIGSLADAIKQAEMLSPQARSGDPSMLPPGGQQIGARATKGTPAPLSLKDATANLLDAVASATGTKQNFLKDGGVRTAAKDFVNALWDAGSRKWSEVLAKGREVFGDTWRKIGQVVKAEWDSFIKYQKAISAGRAGSFATSPLFMTDRFTTNDRGQYGMDLRNPVTLKNGYRLDGFTDKNQTTFTGYDKNGERISINRKYVNPDDIVFSKDSNKTAEAVKTALRQVVNEKVTLPPAIAIAKEPVFKEDLGVSDTYIPEKRKQALAKGRDQFGVPGRASGTTGWFTSPVQVPVSILSRLPGQRAEQSNIRQDSLQYIRDNWEEVSKEPIYIEVFYNGEEWVSEGNHRIMVAKEKGVSSLPVEIRYFDNGQKYAENLSPEKIKAFAASPKKLPPAIEQSAPVKLANTVLGKKQAGNIINPFQVASELSKVVRSVKDALSSFSRPLSPEEQQAASFKNIPGMRDQAIIAPEVSFEEGKQQILAQQKDGSSVWALTPGRIARQQLSGSLLTTFIGRGFENARNRAEFYINERLRPLKKQMQSFLASDKDTALMHDVFMREERNQSRYTPEELTRAGFSPELLETYTLLRQNLDAVWEAQNKSLTDAGKKPLTFLEAYHSARGMGPWTATIRDADGKLVGYLREPSRRSLNKAIAWIASQKPDLVIEKANGTGYDKNFSSKKDSMKGEYDTIRQLLGEDDPLVQEIAALLAKRDELSTENIYGQEAHFKQKSGVLYSAGKRPFNETLADPLRKKMDLPTKGALEDMREMFSEQLKYIENGYIWAEQQKALRYANQFLNDPQIQEAQRNNVMYGRELVRMELGYDTNKIINQIEHAVARGLGTNVQSMGASLGSLKSVFYLLNLAFNIPFMLVTVMTPLLVLPAGMQAAGGNHLKAIALGLTAAPLMFSRQLMDDLSPSMGAKMAYGKSMPLLEEAYQYARDNRVTEVNQLTDIRDVTLPKAINTAQTLAGWTISVFEMASRSMVYSSFVEGLKHKFDITTPEGRLSLFQEAAENTKAIMGDYNPEQKAALFQRTGLTGNALSTLQTYVLNQMFQTWKYSKMAAKGDYKPLLMYLGMLMAAGGAVGLLGMDDLEDMLLSIQRMLPPSMYADLQKMPMLKDPKLWLVENSNDLFSYGAMSTYSGTNIHTRFSLGDVIKMAPFEPSTSPTGDLVTSTVGNLFPFLSDAVKRTVALGKFSSGLISDDPKKMKEAGYVLAPSGARGFYEENVPGFRQGERIMRPSDMKKAQIMNRPLEDKGLREIGLRSLKEQKTLDLGFEGSSRQKVAQEQLKKAGDDLWNAINSGSGVQDAFTTWMALGGNPATLSEAARTYVNNMIIPELQQNSMKIKSSSPAERRKAQEAIRALQIIQR